MFGPSRAAANPTGYPRPGPEEARHPPPRSDRPARPPTTRARAGGGRAAGGGRREGRCDPRGRLWVGTMNKDWRDEAAPRGKLYCLADPKWTPPPFPPNPPVQPARPA